MTKQTMTVTTASGYTVALTLPLNPHSMLGPSLDKARGIDSAARVKALKPNAPRVFMVPHLGRIS